MNELPGMRLTDRIGHTPLIRLNHLSDATGCEILGKAEFMNPGGTVKDRAALGTGSCNRLIPGSKGALGKPAASVKHFSPFRGAFHQFAIAVFFRAFHTGRPGSGL